MNKEKRPGLYIHVPFCRSKCLYCDFYSVPRRDAIPAWLRAVKREMLFHGEQFSGFDSLYIGGGTPTILDERDLASLFESVHKHFSFRPGSETSIEANPDGLTKEKLIAIRRMGVNRITLGVQSLDGEDLKYLGRSHGPGQALAALDLARSSGFSNIGVDLIYGLETQTLQKWKKTIDGVLQFRPEHISCYQLTYEAGTPLWKRKEAGRVRPIGEKLESAFFIWTSRYLERRGYLHYEISNFAAGPEFMSRHNQKYWDHSPYLGLGPSAHSFQAGGAEARGHACGSLSLEGEGRGEGGMLSFSRWWNVRSIKTYCELIEQGIPPVESSEVLSKEQLDLESLYLGLRTRDGAPLHALEDCPTAAEALARMRAAGLVTVGDGRIKPTRRGFLVADSLPLMLCK